MLSDENVFPLVSILIPAYNSSRWIAATIESAIAQTWQHTEIIIVDDGSKDDTLYVAQSYARSNIKVLSQENSGASAARNRAFRESSGTYIQYLDSDDLLSPDKIEKQLSVILTEPTAICSGEWAPFYADPSEAKFINNALSKDLAPTEWLTTAWSNGLMMQPAGWLTPRHLIEQAGPWDESLSLDDDGEFFARVLLTSTVVKFASGARAYYRIGNTNSLSWSYSRKAHLSLYKSVMSTVNLLLMHTQSTQSRFAISERVTFFLFGIYPESQDLAIKAEAFLKDLNLPEGTPRGGPVFNVLVRIVGWRCVKIMRQPYYVLKTLLLSKYHQKRSLKGSTGKNKQ